MAVNRSIVVDASLAVKWVVDEVYTAQAQELFADVTNNSEIVYAPPHFTGETINAIYQKFRSTDEKKHISEEQLASAVDTFLAFPVRVMTPDNLYSKAVEFAKAYKLVTIYDGVYVVLAEILGLELWTADQRLMSQLGSSAPWVHLIAEYPLPQQPEPGPAPEAQPEEPEL
jgi:predicted nucleic acid-binding protein